MHYSTSALGQKRKCTVQKGMSDRFRRSRAKRIEMSGLVDPTNTDVLSRHVDLVDATRILGQPPVDRDGLIKELEQ